MYIYCTLHACIIDAVVSMTSLHHPSTIHLPSPKYMEKQNTSIAHTHRHLHHGPHTNQPTNYRRI